MPEERQQRNPALSARSTLAANALRWPRRPLVVAVVRDGPHIELLRVVEE